ncbi:MAG: TonB-dependent receptor [Pseudomonadales bacterium]|nr:TonB-dependent receptor [Pseudomonadales bacterium]
MHHNISGKQVLRVQALGLAVGLACCSSVTLAQTNTIESIVVTADRQNRVLGDLAASIFAVDSESLALMSHTHINESLARVPGTWISRGNGQESLTAIRSPVLTGGGSCGSFQMSEDGIPLRGAGFCNVNQLFESNTEQAGGVEVIRGPGSILFGANALHGTVNVLSPGVPQEAGASIGLEAGSHGYKRAKVSANTSVGRHGFLVNFNGTSDDGFKDDSGFDQQKVTLRHEYRGNNLSVTNVFSATNLNQETSGFIEGPRAYKDKDLKRSNPNPEAFRDSHSYRLYSRVEWESDAGHWMVTPYYRNTDMNFLQHFLPGTPLETNKHESFGLQTMFTSKRVGAFEFMSGMDFEFTDGTLLETQDAPPVDASPFLVGILPVGKHYDFQVDSQLLSPFAQIRLHATEKDLLSFGLRYEYRNYDYDNRMVDGRVREDGTACPGGCRFNRPADRSDDFDNVSAQLGWIHSYGTGQQVYLNLASAFRAPEANELYRLQNQQSVADLKSEELKSIELGFRGTWEGLSYGVSAYYMDKDNVIFQDSDRNNVSNGKTRHKGVEVNTAMSVTDTLSLTLAGSFARHKYQADIDQPGFSVAIDGNEVDTAPKFTGSAQLNWALNEQQNVELEWVHMGSYFTDELNQNKYPGHELVNLRYQASYGKRWFAGVRITNLLNVDYAERADFAFGNERFFVGEPRSLYVTLGTRF